MKTRDFIKTLHWNSDQISKKRYDKSPIWLYLAPFPSIRNQKDPSVLQLSHAGGWCNIRNPTIVVWDGQGAPLGLLLRQVGIGSSMLLLLLLPCNGSGPIRVRFFSLYFYYFPYKFSCVDSCPRIRCQCDSETRFQRLPTRIGMGVGLVLCQKSIASRQPATTIAACLHVIRRRVWKV